MDEYKRNHNQSIALRREVDDETLLRFTRCDLLVREFGQYIANKVSSHVTLKFVTLFHQLDSITLYTEKHLGELENWQAMLSKHSALRDLTATSTMPHAPGLPAPLIAAIASACTLLCSLTLSPSAGVNAACVAMLAEQCPLLQWLKLGGCNMLGDSSMQALGQHSPQLQELYLHAERGVVTDAGFVALLQGCTKLTSLELWDGSQVTASIVALTPLCTKIMTLALCRCSVLGDTHARAAMYQLRSLRTLNLHCCTGLSEQLLITNPHSDYVGLNVVEEVNNTVLAALVQFCPLLFDVSIRGCTQVTKITPLRNSSQLYILDLSDCTGVTDETVLQLAFAIEGSTDSNLFVSAHGSGITEQIAEIVRGTTRICVDLSYCAPGSSI